MKPKINSVSERLKKRGVTGVDFATSVKGLHIRVNGFREFIISKENLKIIYSKVFEDENNNHTPEQEQGEVSEAGS